MTRPELIAAVKVKLEELTPFDEGLVVLSASIKPITGYIEENIQPSIDELLMICPLHLTTPTMIPVGTTVFSSVTSFNKKVGTLLLPDEFLRLHTFKMKGWDRPVHRPISVENPQYQEQFNRWSRGGNSKPVIALKSDTLEIYTFDEGDTPEINLYVQRIDTSRGFEINQKLVDPLCSLIASKVLEIFGNPQQKEMLQEVENFIKSEL